MKARETAANFASRFGDMAGRTFRSRRLHRARMSSGDDGPSGILSVSRKPTRASEKDDTIAFPKRRRSHGDALAGDIRVAAGPPQTPRRTIGR